MDPYVIIKIGDKSFKTAVHNNGGKTPKWTDVFEHQRTTEDRMDIEVHDKDTFSSDLVGKGSYALGSLCSFTIANFSGNIQIYYNDKVAGDVFL